jgi:hypothetical protein
MGNGSVGPESGPAVRGRGSRGVEVGAEVAEGDISLVRRGGELRHRITLELSNGDVEVLDI